MKKMFAAGNKNARRRGVGFLFFTLVALPCIFASLVISLDVTRIYLISRSAENTATAAAEAGAFQFQRGTYELNQNQAREEAQATLDHSVEHGTVFSSKDVTSNIEVTATSVTVTVDASLEGLSPLGAFIAGWTLEGNVSETVIADICHAGTTYTGGACARPTE